MALALILIIGIDAQVRGDESLLVHGLADEVAHLLTAIICLAAVRAMGVPVHWLPGIIGGVIIDLDHIPLLLDLVSPVPGSSRPESHSLASVAVVLAVGLVVPQWRAATWSMGYGMVTHLFRDTATGSTPLWWPAVATPVHLRYSLYLLVLVVLAAIAAVSARPPRQS